MKTFHPPDIHTLIEMTISMARDSCDLWCDIKVPIGIEEREKLLEFLYQQKQMNFFFLKKKKREKFYSSCQC